MRGRIFFSVVLALLWGGFQFMWGYVYPQLTGIAAARSLNDDSVIGNALSFAFRDPSNTGLIPLIVTIVFALLLIWIWWGAIKKAAKNPSVFLLLTLLLAACAGRAQNASEGTSAPDVWQILPNQTAFQIPAVGGNYSDQSQLDSVRYLESNKVAAKRVQIDKTFVGNATTGFWVPTSFVIIVDRTPAVVHWTMDTTTGTDTSNQSLCTESKESINVCFQLSMAALIREQDASTYLFFFPTASAETGGQVAGVYLALPLFNVVDNQVRQFVQTKIATACSSRTILQIIADKAAIVADAESQAIAYFKTQGITINYLGLGGPLHEDPAVQGVINDTFVAQQRVVIAGLQATQAVIAAQGAAQAAVIKGQGDAQALTALVAASGGDASKLAQALDPYRWNGSRVTVVVGSNSSSIAVPYPTPVDGQALVTSVPPAPQVPVVVVTATPAATATASK